MRVVQLVRGTDQVVAVHGSLGDAADAVGGSKPNIANCCNGRLGLKSAYGYSWKYEESAGEDRGGEEWRPFGPCHVSSLGRLRRTTAGGKAYETSTRDMGLVGGYPTVMIEGKSWPMHRLVAKVFLGLDETRGVNVCFKDGDRLNAAADNLSIGGLKRRSEALAEPVGAGQVGAGPVELTDDYIAGMFDGDGSVVMTLVGTEACKSVQLKAELTQCNSAFLEAVAARLGAGTVRVDARSDKYRAEPAASLRLVGQHATPLLDIVARRGIVKAEQAALALRFLGLPRGAARAEKEAARLRMRDLNRGADRPKDFSRLSDAYVAGLFDAEGSVYAGSSRKYVKITQKSDPRLLEEVRAFLGYGSLSEGVAWKIYSRADIRAFADRVGRHCVLKRDALDEIAKR